MADFLLSILIKFILILLFDSLATEAAVKDWDYSLMDITIANEHPENIEIYVKKTRVSRGVYALSGNVTINTDLLDETTAIHLEFLRSARNDQQYENLPFDLKNNLKDFVNGDYKKMLMSSAKECSNFPQFEDTVDFKDLSKGTVFVMDNCLIKDVDRLPNHLPTGFYRINLNVERLPDIKLQASVFAEITRKVM